MYDCAVIGTGPAGISAALTLKALKKNFIWLGSKSLSSKISSAEKINNYPGLAVGGEQMQKAFLSQIEELGIEITPGRVTGVYASDKGFNLLFGDEIAEAATVILATGVEAIKPVKGETQFIGRGVSYCATCDGFLYRDKTIAVVCTSKQFEHEIQYLASIARKVYVLALYKGACIPFDNCEILTGSLKEIAGSVKAEKLILSGGEIEVDGVFMLKESVVPSVLLSGLETSDGHVLVNRAMQTNVKGCFAAGDCTGRPYQYAKAVGEGNVAAHSVNAYLSGERK